MGEDTSSIHRSIHRSIHPSIHAHTIDDYTTMYIDMRWTDVVSRTITIPPAFFL